MSKIGLLVECGRDGLEVVMCRRIVALLNAEKGSNLQIDAAPMVNKQRLIEECGTATAALLSQGCERVLILWDERLVCLQRRLIWYALSENLNRGCSSIRPCYRALSPGRLIR